MSKQQTALDWLIQTLESDIEVDESNMVTIKMHEHDYITSKNIAFQMEKDQIMNAQMNMFHQVGRTEYGIDYQEERDEAEAYAEQYYYETYI